MFCSWQITPAWCAIFEMQSIKRWDQFAWWKLQCTFKAVWRSENAADLGSRALDMCTPWYIAADCLIENFDITRIWKRNWRTGVLLADWHSLVVQDYMRCYLLLNNNCFYTSINYNCFYTIRHSFAVTFVI